MDKIRKTLKNFLYAVPIALMSVLPGCEPEEPFIPEPPKDTTAPKINILSPLEQKVYDSNIIPFEWAIEEANFKSAWYSLDNEATKSSIEKSGKKDLSLENGDYKLTTYADDKSNNFSKKDVSFSINKITDNIPPKINILSPLEGKIYDINELLFQWGIEEDNFKSAWYSINNGIKNQISKSGKEELYFENGNHKIVVGADDLYSNFSKDSVMFSVDKPTWMYLVNPFVQPNDTTKPIIWNNFTTTGERNAHFDDRLYNYDKVDTLNIPGWVCTDYARTFGINFNGYDKLGPDPLGLYTNNWHNIPVYMVTLMKPKAFHEIDCVMIGDYVSDISDWRFIEPGNDSTRSLSSFDLSKVYKIVLNYTFVNKYDGLLDGIPFLEFIPDGNGGWKDSGYRNPEISLIEQRK